MTPEISRRCRACGASVRAGGRFCQQCGEKFEATPGGEAADANTDPNENVNANAAAPEAPKPAAPEEYAGAFRRPASGAPPPAHAPEVREVKPARDENNGAAGEVRKSEPPSPSAAPPVAPPVTRPGVPPPAPPAPPAPSAATPDAPAVKRSAVEGQGAAAEGAKGRRAAAVRESLRPRVERVRDASMGVIEEASEDTGLRFVLISLAFFLLFLLLLLLNSMLK